MQCYIGFADQGPYIGAYKHIYPFVDISQDQLTCSVAANGTCPLYFALLMSFGGEYDSSGVIPGVQLALDQINNDPTMLPGYSLHYTLKDATVSVSFMNCLALSVLIIEYPSYVTES